MVFGDEIPEADETFGVQLSGVSGATLGDGNAIGTIVDDDDEVVADTYLPDAQARATRSGPWLGNDVYSDGTGQVLNVKVRKGRSRTVWLRVQNDGSAPDAWSFAEAGPGGKRIARTWLLGRKNVTRDIDQGLLSFHDVAPGDSRTVRLVIRAGKRAKVGSVARWQLHGVHSPAADGIRDVVGVRVKVIRR